ncbi:MAB_1171c family putative transporter [Nocardia sp. NPDC127579]|uniref:MAB_1171c family putative transporter n=1 Tax=Nocardia sp. NPDC127579 TaxID=3345402 RepID=UPI00362F07DB
MPTPLFVATAVFLAVVLAGRWWLVNELNSDRLLNRAFTWNLGGMLLWGAVAASGAEVLGHQLYLAVGVLAVANLVGVGMLFAGAEPRRVWQRQRRYDAVAALISLATLVCVLAFPDDAQLIGILWSLGNLALGVVAGVVAVAALRDVRSRSRTTRQRLAYAALFLVCGYSAIAAPLGACGMLGIIAVPGIPGGQGPRDISGAWIGASFLTLGVITAVLTIPLARALLTRTGWDAPGRACRRLHPLWSDLTTAVPEVVLGPDQHPDSELRLYRMTVEIRDALVRLRPYLPVAEPGASDYARQLAQAARARAAGIAPTTSLAVVENTRADRDTELRDLFALADVWSSIRDRSAE